MTDDEHNDDSDDSDNDDAHGSVPLGNVFETLTNLLNRLDEMDLDEGESRSGTVRRGDATFDYNVNIGSINPAGESRRNRRSPGQNWDIKGKSEDREYRVRVNEEEGKLVVIADLPAVSDDELDVGTNDDTGALEIRVDGETVETIPLDWNGAKVTDVTFTNQILEVHVEPPSDTDENDDGDKNGGRHHD